MCKDINKFMLVISTQIPFKHDALKRVLLRATHHIFNLLFYDKYMHNYNFLIRQFRIIHIPSIYPPPEGGGHFC